jgi:long-chain acyl-CoA synthetase
MQGKRAESESAAAIPDLAEATRGLRTARTRDARIAAAQALVQAAELHCADDIDITALAEGAGELLAAVDTAAEDDSLQALVASAHAYIDLARWTSVRRAAYPVEPGRPGGRWLERIIELIDRAHFTLGPMFRQRAAQYPQKTLFVVPHGEGVTEYTWQRVSEMTEQIACGMLALMGDDARVAIFTPNRIEGALCDLACLTNGIFNTVVAANALGPQLEHILFESGAKMLIVGGAQQLQAALAVFERASPLEWLVTLDALPTIPERKILTLPKLMERAKHVSNRAAEQHSTRVRSRDLATTMYTSGTSGAPKGVKFSHLNLVSKRFARIAALPDIDQNEQFLCYLPLYHTFGRYLEMLGAAHLAATYIFAEDPSTETLLRNMRQSRPTAMISVPKKWLDVFRRVVANVDPTGDSEKLRRTLRDITGGRLRWGLSAAGHLDSGVFRFFQRHGVDLLSGYGMTEATGGVTMTPPGRYVDDSIGKALPAIELGFAEDNELLLRGPYVSSGYTDPQDNAAAYREGWFCTGDIVSRDSAGYLKYVDRNKDIYKNASGRTIAPQRIEGLFADCPEVSRVFAAGDGREHVTLLIHPNLDCPDVALGEMTPAELRAYFHGLVVSCNRFLAPYERVVDFALIDRDFSLEAGELTPKGAMRRSVIHEHFRDAIEPMYESTAIERVVDEVCVRIPIAFLQHLGTTEAGTQVVTNGLLFRALADRTLTIRRDPHNAGWVWVGNCCYADAGNVIDLDDWLRLPELWVGNAELTSITGESILLWSHSGGDRAPRSTMVRVAPPRVPIDEWHGRLEGVDAGTPGLLSVHAAAVTLSRGSRAAVLRAADYLVFTMIVGREHHQQLAQAHLQLAALHRHAAVRGRAFAGLLEDQPVRSFRKTAALFCESLLHFLDKRTCERIAHVGIAGPKWAVLRQELASLRSRMTSAPSRETDRFVARLLRSLGQIAKLAGGLYPQVRQELAAWALAPVSPTVRTTATKVGNDLTAAFRRQLGTKQHQAVDPEKKQGYTWDDTLVFEDGIDAGERDCIARAFRETELVREAVKLLHQQREIDLQDLQPRSIWVSLIASRFGRSVYHVGVRTRSHERLDFALYVRSTASVGTFRTDLRLLCLVACATDPSPLTPRFAGYWPEFRIATLEHVRSESLETLVHYMHEHPDHAVRQRLESAWQHLCWSGLAAAFEFHQRTEGRWTLSGAATRCIRVPLDDFGEDARVLVPSGWEPFDGALTMLLRLKQAFLDRVRYHFPALAQETPDELLFSAALEANGWQGGLTFLRQALDEAERFKKDAGEAAEFCRRMRDFVKRTSEFGYMPRRLHFAIARYHAWARRVPDASPSARVAQLQQLERNYRIDALAQKCPEARLWLHTETVFKESPEEGRDLLAHAMRSLREGAAIQEVLGQLYSDFQQKLPAHDEQYFLSRVAFPHLALDEKAELVTSAEAGASRVELVTFHTDRLGRQLRVRPPRSPAEMDALYRVFYAGGMAGGLSAHEAFLVASDESEFVVGGVGYIRRTPYHVLLDKLAVLPSCRRRGIGRLLLEEFLRRTSAEGAVAVSAEFIRDSWLGQFGFRAHPQCAGVVLRLTQPGQTTRTGD